MKYHQIDFMYEGLQCIEKDSIDLIISSVPLAILESDIDTLFSIFDDIMKPTGWILIDAPRNMGLDEEISKVGAQYGWILIQAHSVYNMYPNSDQVIYCFSKEKWDTIDKKFRAFRFRTMAHPCEFCPHLIAEFIEQYSTDRDVVLDPFCGTGTVPGEAELANRIGIGCDLRPESNIREEYR